MRALHLLGLGGDAASGARFRPSSDLPLVLPGYIRALDREVITALYQQLLWAQPGSRIEVDWHSRLLPSSAAMLDQARVSLGARQVLLVVRVQRADAELEPVLAEPRFEQFEHVVLCCEGWGNGERLGTLVALCKHLEGLLLDAYQRLCPVLGIQAEHDAWMEGLIHHLLNPMEVMGVVNDAIELQLEGLDTEATRHHILRRLLLRQLAWRSPAQLAAMLELVRVGQLPAWDDGHQRRLLRAEMLLGGGKVRGWLSYLHTPALWASLLEGPRAQLPTPAQRAEDSEQRLASYGVAERAEPSANGARMQEAFDAVRAGRLELANSLLTELDPLLGRWTVLDRGEYEHILGVLRRAEGAASEAVTHLTRALALLEAGGATPTSRGITLHELARGLRDNGRWDEAESALREAERLLKVP